MIGLEYICYPGIYAHAKFSKMKMAHEIAKATAKTFGSYKKAMSDALKELSWFSSTKLPTLFLAGPVEGFDCVWVDDWQVSGYSSLLICRDGKALGKIRFNREYELGPLEGFEIFEFALKEIKKGSETATFTLNKGIYGRFHLIFNDTWFCCNCLNGRIIADDEELSLNQLIL